MTQAQHTPGPWMVRNGDQVVSPANDTRPYSVRVADCYGYKEAREADARLIAAAPAMLAALEGLLSQTLSNQAALGQEAVRKARAAIAAARGEG